MSSTPPTVDNSGITVDDANYTIDGGVPPPAVSVTFDNSNVTFDNTGYTMDGGTYAPSPGFRVMAVTSGWYGDQFRTQGDVFDLVDGHDFSNYQVNYGPYAETNQFGWMMQVPASTPLFDWLSSNVAPYLPPQDPLRRTVY